MRTFLITVLTLSSIISHAQNTPIVTFASSKIVKGQADKGTTVEVSINDDFVADQKTTADAQTGDFEFSFVTPLTEGKNIILWTMDKNNNSSQKIVAKIENADNLLQTLTKDSFSTRKFTDPEIAGKTVRYKSTILNTNFSIPLARFNFTKDSSQKTGDLLLFNSIGAGFGLSFGELSETRDFDGKLINQDFVNTFGIHAGFLFSAGTGDDTKNVFAPTVNISLLDFQLGIGYELGNLLPDQKPLFLTLSYAIPLYKLRKGGFWIWKSSEPINDTKESRLGE